MDVVVGAACGYNYDQVKFWINSLNRSGFEGKKYLLCYGFEEELRRRIEKQGVITISFELSNDDNIVVTRFWAYWQFLNSLLQIENPDDPFRYLIATDVKDVIFQSNPSTWLDNYGFGELILSSESLKYIDEPWGFNNILQSFGPVIQAHYRNMEIVNCGVLCGEFNTLKDLFLNIYMISRGSRQFIQGGGGPDQAALNVLTSLSPYNEVKQVTTPWHGWAAQLGTTGDPSKLESFSPHLLHAVPIYRDGYFLTPEKAQNPLTPFAIAHQWDRMDINIVNEVKEKYS